MIKYIYKKLIMAENKSKKETIDSIIRNHMVWSMGAGLIPVPIADFFAVSAIQLDMIRQIAKVHDIDFSEQAGKASITALTGSGLARLGARAVKFIPGVGSILGGITMSALSGASTYALGEVFSKHFETGGTFLDFDVDRVKKFYDEKFEKGKDIAKEITQEEVELSKQGVKKDFDVEEFATDTLSEDTDIMSPAVEYDKEKDDPISKILELAELKSRGIITEEEFTSLKKKIINS